MDSGPAPSAHPGMTANEYEHSVRHRKLAHGPRPHRRTIDAPRQRARADQRQGAGVAPAQLARQQGPHRLLQGALALLRRDGLCRPAGAGRVRRQRPRLHGSRRRDGGDRPHLDAVAVPRHQRGRGLGAESRRQCRAEVGVSAEDLQRLAARDARDRRGRKASPASDQPPGRARRQRFQALRRQGAGRRRPRRRPLHRRRAHCWLRRRARRA